jgi:hypothetical protein
LHALARKPIEGCSVQYGKAAAHPELPLLESFVNHAW